MTESMSEWAQRFEEREALAASHDYADPMARRCADRPHEQRLVYAFGVLVEAVKDDQRDRDNLKVLAHELDIACCFEVTP
jgi:hypothetical protein